MSLVGAVYIEELKSGPLRGDRPSAHHVLGHPPIHDMLAPAIGVERAQRSQRRSALVVAEPGAAIAIGSGGRSIDEAGGVGGAPIPKIERQADIVDYEPGDIGVGC